MLILYIIAVPTRSTIHGNYKICQLISVVQFMCQCPLLLRFCENVSDFYKIRGFVSPILSTSYRGQNYDVFTEYLHNMADFIVSNSLFNMACVWGGNLCLSDHCDILSISWSSMHNTPPKIRRYFNIQLQM